MPLALSQHSRGSNTRKSGHTNQIVLKSATNLIQMQKQLNGVSKHHFEFLSARNGIKVIKKDMLD
jgi:hypothetical protein